MTSYTLRHLFQSLFFIYMTHINFQSQLKSEKQTIFLEETIKQKYICHLNNCLSDLFYPGIQKYLMFEVFTSNNITVEQANKQGTFGICICTYTIYSFKIKKCIYTTCFHFLIWYVFSSKFSKLFHKIWFFSMSKKSFLSPYCLALQFDCPIANFVPLLRVQPQ